MDKNCNNCKHIKWETCYFREVDAYGDQVVGKEQYTSDYPCRECSLNYILREMWEAKDD